MHAISIFPWNLTEFCLAFSSIIISYSPCISARGDSIEYFFVSVTPLVSSVSNFLKYLNFSLNNSSLDICGWVWTGLSGFIGTLLNLANPSHVLLSPSAVAVACPRLAPLLSSKRTDGLSSKLFPLLNKSERLSNLALSTSSVRLFNSSSKLFKSSSSISEDFLPEPSFFLSFISNSRPPPKLVVFELPPEREFQSSFKFSFKFIVDISIISSIYELIRTLNLSIKYIFQITLGYKFIQDNKQLVCY